MSETTSPAQDPPSRICSGSFLNYPSDYLDVGHIIASFNLAINEMDSLPDIPGKTCDRQCSSCPAFSLLELAAELINDLGQLLADVPNEDCPAAASFNLSNIRPSLSTGQGNPGNAPVG